MKNIVLVFGIAMLLLASCKKSEERPEEKQTINVIGKWRISSRSFVSYGYTDKKLKIRSTNMDSMKIFTSRVLSWEFKTDSTYENTVYHDYYNTKGNFTTKQIADGSISLVTDPSTMTAIGSKYKHLLRVRQPGPNTLETTEVFAIVPVVGDGATLDSIFSTFIREPQ